MIVQRHHSDVALLQASIAHLTGCPPPRLAGIYEQPKRAHCHPTTKIYNGEIELMLKTGSG
ncbi:hypothetical protein GCM10027288_53480 [Bordetella tumbae]